MIFRSILLGCLILPGSTALAAPSCARIKANPVPWVHKKIDALISVARESYDNGDRTESYAKVLGSIAATIRRCNLSKDDDFRNRYREFVEYVDALSLDLDPDHELGFAVSDREYFAETRRLTRIPPFLLAPEFLRAVSRHETLDRAKAFLRKLNQSRGVADQLVFFSFISRHLGTPDNDDSFRRLLIVVPGDERTPEKWVQFGVTDPGVSPRIRNISVVATMPRGNGTFDTYFKDYFRTYRRNGSISVKGRWELGYGDDNCAQCHKSGVLPIFPARGSVSPDEADALRAVNERFRGYGSPRFDKYSDQSKFGPGLGTNSGQERKVRFGAAFDGTRVANSMSCASCHNPDRLGSLSWPMDMTLISSMIEGGQMPKGIRLPETERRALHEKLIEEYFSIDDANPGILKAWLLGKRR